MKNTGCEKEARILEALGQGLTQEAFEEPLRRHVESCSSCAELISLYKLFQSDSGQLEAAAPVPEPGAVWWRATMAARRAAADRAMRPIRVAEKIALAIGGGVLMALLILAAPWLAQQTSHSNIFSGAAVFTISLSSLILPSIFVSLLLMAGALYALWAEK